MGRRQSAIELWTSARALAFDNAWLSGDYRALPMFKSILSARSLRLCDGPSLTMNSRATSVTRLRLHRSPVVGWFVLWREIYHQAILDFCNTICHKREIVHPKFIIGADGSVRWPDETIEEGEFEDTGGPQKYTGRSMKESHQHLMITAAEWEAFLDDLQQTLDKFAVPPPEQAEIKVIVASTRADIVV